MVLRNKTRLASTQSLLNGCAAPAPLLFFRARYAVFVRVVALIAVCVVRKANMELNGSTWRRARALKRRAWGRCQSVCGAWCVCACCRGQVCVRVINPGGISAPMHTLASAAPTAAAAADGRRRSPPPPPPRLPFRPATARRPAAPIKPPEWNDDPKRQAACRRRRQNAPPPPSPSAARENTKRPLAIQLNHATLCNLRRHFFFLEAAFCFCVLSNVAEPCSCTKSSSHPSLAARCALGAAAFASRPLIASRVSLRMPRRIST